MPANAANLNKILRLTANLLFEKGETPKDVYRLMSAFVEKTKVDTWHRNFMAMNGYQNRQKDRAGHWRLPLPPINWDAITVESLQNLTTLPSEEPESYRAAGGEPSDS